MVRKSEQKKRGNKKRTRKKVIWLGVEGSNKTERQYFNFFNKQQDKYVIRFAKGNYTDPMQIVNSLKNEIKEDGDLAFAVFDTDTDLEKEETIRKARELAINADIRTAISNPCFEVWYILHYIDSTAAYISNDAVLKKLRQYLPDYEKNQDVCSELSCNTKEAILRAERLRKYHQEQGHEQVMEQNPSTGIDQIVKLLVD